MILEEGGVRIENTVLFGKYQVCRVIGTGRTGCVFLAVHLGLKEYRAVKRVPKECLDYQQFRQEGLILKELRHPGIPIVYDLEEDEFYCYLIEEYLEGNSLHDLVKDLGHLSEAAVILYGTQICRIVNYLHSAGTYPILHLDLQPKNLLLCPETNTIRLVDFGHAATVTDANLTRLRYGTIGFAAPEQYTDQPLDERTDIYAIGVILHYMGTGTYPDSQTMGFPNKQLEGVIRICLKADKDSRYQSADQVLTALERANSTCNGVFTKDQLSSLTIAFAGSKSGVGTTHLAIGLSVYLKKLGIPNRYEEKNPSGMACHLGAYFGAVPDKQGLIHIKQCIVKPMYGECVKLKETTEQMTIADYGSDLEALCRQKDCYAVIVVSGGMWWETEELRKSVLYLKPHAKPIIIFPASIREYKYRMPEEIKELSCYLAPRFSNPFYISSQAETFYKELLKEILSGKGVGTTPWLKFLKKIQNICRRIGEP